MEPSARRQRFQNFQTASAAIQLQKAANQEEDPFPDIEVEEEKNPILKSVDEISSSQSYSSDTSSEEEKKEFQPKELADKPKYRKSKVRRSILKSHYLTNKRQSRGSKHQGTRKDTNRLNKKFEIKQASEGRLPIRRPSNADAVLQGNPFNEQRTSLSVLAKVKDQILNPDNKEEKGELDYITVNESGDKEDLNSFLSRSLFTNKFQLVWAFILFISHTYNILVLFYYLGIPDFPQNALLGLQNFFEFVLIIDIIMRMLIKSLSFEVWESMWLLHDYFAFSSKLGIILTIISSIPLMFLVSLSTSDLAVQSSFWVACMRIPKIIRIREVNKIFSNYSRAEKAKSGFSSFFVAAYSLFLATHIIGCIWLIVGRLDPDEDNWQKMDNFDKNPSNVQQYIEACFFTVATMTGLGYGNVIPTTDLEVFIIMFIMVTGASIYANFFANFIVTMNNRNAKTIEKMKKHDQAKNFGNELNLPDTIMMKIRYFYNELSIKYGDIYERYSNLKELPTSLSSELSLFLNSNLIKSVKMFQFSHPMFILSVARAMMPKLCMANDYVIELGNIAEDIYFVKKGVVEVLATDNQTVIAYLSEGSYFGEIGVLLTGVRSVSVRAKTLCIFFTIDKDEILKILERFPEQKAFLRSVGRQRLQTTNPEDLNDEEEEELDNLLANQSLLQDLNNEIKLDEESKFSKIQSMANLSMQIKKYKKRKDLKLPWNVTKHYPILDRFIIIPFSLLFYIWAGLTILACAYTLFIVPFSISYEYHYDAWLIPFDIIFQIILGFDIFITIKTALNKNFEISVDLKEVAIDYMDTRIFFDILAVLPLDYVLMIFDVNQQTVAWIRIFRILKLYKPFDYIKIWRKHSNIKIALFTLFLLSILFVIISHLMGCIYFYIGRHENGGSSRYDGQSLFENTLDRDFLNLKPVMEMSIIEQYIHFFYLSACTMGAVMYGDMIPLTPLEQIFTFGAMFTARIYLAFLYAEAAAYLSSVNSAYSSRLKVKSTIGKTPELNELSFDMKKRVYTYHEILGNNFKGVTESQVLNDLPESIEKQIKDNLFKDLIRNITLFPKDDKSAIAALIWRLELHLLSNGEYVIKDGEIADCMYFIIRGKVEVIKSGVILAVLEQGAHFGEMALAEGKPTTRAASARCITSCSVGSLSIQNFNVLCEFYPIFKSKIQEEVSKRKEDLRRKTKKPDAAPLPEANRKKSIRNSTKNIIRDKSRTSNNKGSRQSAYEVSNADDLNFRRKERMSVFESPRGTRSKRSSVKSEDKHLEQIKTQANQILENEENSKQNNDQADDSKAPLVLQENPNMPDDEIIPNPNIYQDGDEESHKSEDNSIIGSKSSGSNLERKKKAKENSGEAEVKVSSNKFWLIRQILAYISWTRGYQIIDLLFVLYNMIFIPLQAAYRIEYSAAFITMEIFTIMVYSFDIYMLFLQHKNCSIEIQNQENNIDESDRHIQDFNILKKSLKWMKFRIVVSIVCILPFSIIFQLSSIDDPLLIIFYLKCLRLIKLYPILKIFEGIKQKALNFGRIIEMLFLYYTACHVIACSFINIAYKQDDIRNTWLTRLTVPQPDGMRPENNFDGLSDTTIYVHALEFTVNTVSHLAIGEITTINYRERIYNAFVILCGTFIYAFLFGNIASIMTEFAAQMPFFKLHKQFEDVMNSLNKDAVPVALISTIKDYYDYIWANNGGASQADILMDYLNVEAANKSIIFKDQNGDVDNALTNSVMTYLEYRIYMDGDFIIIGGSSSMNTYFLLEGEAIILGLNEEFIGYMKTGGHYSNDLDDDNENIFDYKRPFHIVSKGISKVGILNRSKLDELYIAFPNFKETLRELNTNFSDYVTKFCRKYLKSNKLDYNAENVIKTVSNHYCYSTNEVYNSVLKKCKAINLESDEIKNYDIIIKQQEVSLKHPARRMGSKRRSSNIIMPVNFFAEEEDKQGWFDKIKFDKNSTLGRIIDFLNLINLLYVAVSIPLLISFDIKMTWYLALLEICSLLFTLVITFLNFRNPVHLRGGKTLKFKVVLAHYYRNGLILDLFALWPLSLVLAITDTVQPLWLVTPLKCVRLISVWKILTIFGRFELFFKKLGLVMNIIKATLFLCISWHWTACTWYFTNLYINLDKDDSWIEFNDLQDGPLYKQIMFSYYTIMNVVSTVGYGDMFPMTDVERMFMVFLINCGDLIFAVAFGLIAGITMQASNNKSTEIFFKKMHMIKELISQNRGDDTQKSKVEQYFAYSWHLHKSTKMFSIKSLSTQLPYRLSREVVYFSTRHLLEPMFKSFGSENLIKDISTSLVQTIYLPGDFIILKDDIGEEMYFIAEGSVYILAADKRTVLNTLTQGYYFGEMAIFLKSNRRSAYVQAETFCSILILKKYDLDNIKVNYPAVAKDIIKEAEKRQAETKEIEEAYKDEIWDDDGKDAEDHKQDLERIYGTPPGIKKRNFSPKMFDLTSRRSSFQGRNSGKDELTQKKFYKNLVVGESNSSDNDPNASFKKLKKIFPKHHSDQNITKSVEENKGSEPRKKSQFLSEETKEAISTSKKKSLVERKSNMTKKVIHEDVENEDKASISLNSQEETKLLRDKRNARVASFSPMVGAEISREDLNLDKLKMTKREHSMNHVLSKKATELRTMWKRSTTEYMKDEDQSSSLYKSRIDQIVTEVDMERKLNSRTPKRMQERKSLFGGPENQIIDYRRQGVNQNGPSVHKQRRLSRINLGKQLELSETLGLRLQWRVD